MGYFVMNTKNKDSIEDWLETLEANLELFKNNDGAVYLMDFIIGACEEIKRLKNETTEEN